ncbi:MAG: EscU/YscU/HrcU family type III secretion system export apparatus switch protein [Gammaproteobacteria bacterium]|nr:MAG: EscU/YscU/HrcU family type III secretion system export apparatus switch protein [Gammaproteobacteria bacterium]
MTQTNGQTLAVALKYDGENAPKVTAKGSQEIAEQIIELAKKHNVPLSENKELVTLLSTLELGDEIPEVLYLAVAEVIAFAYMLKGKVPVGFEPG